MNAGADGPRAVQAKAAVESGPEAVDLPRTPSSRLPLVAVAGNPNTGKTTLFNRLTGGDQKVGNYPGVTVERVVGESELHGIGRVRFVDVPGTYSLSARSEEESIAVGAIAGLPPHEIPDAVLVVVDATQLTRNLYLALQLIEIDVPVIVALNMSDLAAKGSHEVDAGVLAQELGVPVVPMTALKGTGLQELRTAVTRVLLDPRRGRPGWRWRPETSELLDDVRAVSEVLPESWWRGSWQRRDSLALWALLSADEHDESEGGAPVPEAVRVRVNERRAQALAAGRQIDSEVIAGRYAWIDARAERFLVPRGRRARQFTGRIDSLLLHPAAGFLMRSRAPRRGRVALPR
jgi:ferrous iron transport protein B